jgi:sugar lactone lactonase YvrE
MSMAARTATVIRDGFQYLEGARWYQGELWCSDIPQGKVHRLSPNGHSVTVAAQANHPSGLGFAPDGTVLFVTMRDSQLRRITSSGGTEIVADLSDVAVGANDMWVDKKGRAYITQLGYLASEALVSSPMVIVSPTGRVSTAGQGLTCPNGVGLSPDGKVLYVAETLAARVSAFDVDADGGLSNQRVVKQFDSLEADRPDGLCVDSAGGIWVTIPFSSEVRRIQPDGTQTDTVNTAAPGHLVVSCALGGDDLRTLYLCTADTDLDRLRNNFTDTSSRIEAVTVDIPGIR